MMNRVPTYILVLAAAAIAAAAFGIWTLSNRSRAAVARWNANTETQVEKTDPKLIAFTEGQRIATRMKHPRGIALGIDGGLYVVGDRAVSVFGTEGKAKNSFRLEQEPRCVAVSADGTIYLGIGDHVEVYAPSGARRAKWDSFGPKAFVTSISVAGNVAWIADAGQRVVYKCDVSGTVIASFGKKDQSKGVPGLVIPSPYMDVVAVAGDVWVANTGLHRLELYGPDGKIKRSWGEEGFDMESFCGCCNPADFAVFPDGRFVTGEKGLPRVKVYGADGKFLSVVAGPESFGEDDTGLDLAVSSDGRVFVLDPMAKAVRVFVPKEKAK